MKERSSECKGNNAACVNGMMPGRVWTALLRRAPLHHTEHVITGGGRQKQLDIGPDIGIIIFTDLLDSFRVTHGRQRCQVRGAATTGDAEPTGQKCPGRTISSGRLFRSPRPGPGQVRDAAPSADRRPVGYGRIGELRFFATIFLSSVIRLRAGRPSRPGATQARSEASAQNHRRSPRIHRRGAPERTIRSIAGTGEADSGSLRHPGSSAKHRTQLATPSKKLR